MAEEKKTEAGQQAQVEEKKPKQEEAPKEKHEEKKPKQEEAPKEKPEVKLSKAAEDVLKTVGDMSVMELSNLVKALEDKFGVSAAMPVMAAQAGGGQAAGGAQEEEKSTFTAELSKVGANKIQVIKEIRAITSLGLKEAKDLVDSAPKPIKEGVTKEEGEEIKKKLTAVGATVELK